MPLKEDGTRSTENRENSGSLIANVINSKITRRSALAVGLLSLITIDSGVFDKYAKFLPVWKELQEFLHPLPDAEVIGKAYNPNKEIILSPQYFQNLLIVVNGDSMNLCKGKRDNSQGLNQPGCWAEGCIKSLNSKFAGLGLKRGAFFANYAQPGASSQGIIGLEFGKNVQLGAQKESDMVSDYIKVPTPADLMINHNGTVVATLGMNGNDFRDSIDLTTHYMSREPEFGRFVRSPSVGNFTDRVSDIILHILHLYKADKERLHNNFTKILNRYQYISNERLRLEKSPIILVCTLPISYKYSDNAPDVQLNAQQGQGGHLDFSQFPEAREVGARLTNVMYEVLNPLLKNFSRSSGIGVSTIPMFDLSKNHNLFEKDGHFNELGEAAIGDMVSNIFVVSSHQINHES